ISMNGLTEEEFDNYQYENLPLATFYLDNKTEKINVMTKDIHYFNFENMFKKIAGLQLKPKLMLVYIENYVSAILAYNDMKKNGYLNQVNDKIIQYETNIMKFDKFKDQLKREVQVSDEEIANFYEKNKSNYVEPPRRKTYGISVTMSDSAKLFADYKKMTVKNLIDYYVKYSPYIKSKKNVKMRLLGDFQKNSFGLISEEAFKLSKPNTLSKIVKYNSLFYVFYYTEESNSRQQELSEVSNLIFDELAEQKYKSKTDSIDQLIDARFADTSHYYKSNL
ncbi:MAG: peptidyl-prolyl cis-trans isomerase, partial [Calditrichaeota bacterium]|nr:peptidyl-prolyl cis-trans isomerase [Calditrichota bacterium]